MSMRFSVLLFASSLLLFANLHAQSPQAYADSLERVIPTLEGQQRFQVFHRLAETYQRIDYEKAKAYCDSAKSLAEFLGRPDLLAQSLNTQGKLQHMKGQYLLASISFSSALTNASKGSDQKLIMLLNNALGISYLMAGEFDKSFEHFSTVERYFRQEGLQPQVASTLLNIGSLYKMRGDIGMAKKVLTETLEISKSIGHQELQLKCLSALGKVCESNRDFDEAMKYQIRALAIGEEREYPGLIISCKNNIGQLYQQQEEYSQAKMYYQEALTIAREKNMLQMMQSLSLSLGKLARVQENHWEALTYLEEAESLAERMGSDSFILETATELGELYQKLGNYQKAFLYSNRAASLRFERQEKMNSDRMQELLAAYDAEQKEKELLQLRKQRLDEQYKTIGVSALAGFALLALLGLYVRYRERQKSFSILNEQHRKIQHQNRILQQQFSEIEDKNSQLAGKTQEIKTQNRQLQMVNMELKHFARAASHDLREPLRAIRSYMNLLGTRYEQDFDHKAKEFLSMASAGAVRMEDLLNDLYQHAQVGRSKEDLRKVSIEKLVKEVLSDLHVSISEKDALVAFENLPEVMGFQTELRMLLQNLVSNAVKFTPDGSPPKVLITGREDASNWYLEVKDHGIGIPEEYHDKIFAIFERLHSRDEFAGSGIGLATCQKVVQHHGGEISVESKPGFGTTFTVSLPKS